MTSAEHQIVRIFEDNAEQAAKGHPGKPTEADYAAALAPTADMCGVSVDEVKRVIRDNTVMGAC